MHYHRHVVDKGVEHVASLSCLFDSYFIVSTNDFFVERPIPLMEPFSPSFVFYYIYYADQSFQNIRPCCKRLAAVLYMLE